MVMYAEVGNVSNELNGFTINSTTTPSINTVEDWISQESDLLKRETGQIWGAEVISDEYLDYDGSGFIRTNYSPIVNISNLSYDSGSTSENWNTLSEGKYNNFIVYNDEGEIRLMNTSIKDGIQNIKLNYIAGYETVNETVVQIVSKKVALRIISTVLNESSSTGGGSINIGAISISDPSPFQIDNVKRISGDIVNLTNELGSLKIYRYNR